MANRFADSITFVAEEEIVQAIKVVGTGPNRETVGKAVVYGTQEIAGNPGCKVAQDGDFKKFAGIIKVGSATSIVSRMATTNVPPSNQPSGAQYYNDGDRTVLEGETAAVERNVETDVLLEGTVAFGDFLTPASDGKLKATTNEAEKVAIAHQAGKDGEIIKAYIYA